MAVDEEGADKPTSWSKMEVEFGQFSSLDLILSKPGFPALKLGSRRLISTTSKTELRQLQVEIDMLERRDALNR